ncbi:hypothetical protein FCV25MIE_18986 [Fagus crenata]
MMKKIKEKVVEVRGSPSPLYGSFPSLWVLSSRVGFLSLPWAISQILWVRFWFTLWVFRRRLEWVSAVRGLPSALWVAFLSRSGCYFPDLTALCVEALI